MSKIGRPKGINNKDYTCTIRLNDTTLSRLEKYCSEKSKGKSEVIRDAIDLFIPNMNETNKSNYTLKVVSLFSGIGGFEEGLNKSKINYNIVMASEIDNFAQISYTANFGNNKLVGDIKAVDENSVPEHDLLVAGFPCQSFSIAGKQKGFNDIRGTLFFDIVRILKVKRPKYILLENVKNLISHDNSNTIRIILRKLNELGYTVDFSIINSYEAGVPQNRDRTYICGVLNLLPEKFEKDIRNKKINTLKMELNKTNFKGFNFFNSLKFLNNNLCIQDILEENVKPSFFLDTEVTKNFLNNYSIEDIEKKEKKIIKLFDLPKDIYNDLERQRRVYSTKGISPTVLARADSTKILVEINGEKRIRKVTPVENFYIQGFTKAFVERIKSTGMSATQMYKQSGNAVSPPVITGIANHLFEEFIEC